MYSWNGDVKMQFTDEQFKKDSERLIDFIYKSPSPYHVVNNIAAVLNENGFIRLSEGKAWKINPSTLLCNKRWFFNYSF